MDPVFAQHHFMMQRYGMTKGKPSLKLALVPTHLLPICARANRFGFQESQNKNKRRVGCHE